MFSDKVPKFVPRNGNLYYSEIIWPDFILAVNVSHTLLRNLEIAIRLKVLDEERVVRLLVRQLVVKMGGEQCGKSLLVARDEEILLCHLLASLKVNVY